MASYLHFLCSRKGAKNAKKKTFINRRDAEGAEKIFICRKARKNAPILKNQINAFLCALSVFCGKRCF
jgi:hypothetical protein